MQQEILAITTNHWFLLQCGGQDSASLELIITGTSQDDAPLPASSVCPPAVRAASGQSNHAPWCNLQTLSLTTAPKWATATSHIGARWEHLVFAQVFPKPEVWWRFCWGEKMQGENVTSCDMQQHGKLPVFTFFCYNIIYVCLSLLQPLKAELKAELKLIISADSLHR